MANIDKFLEFNGITGKIDSKANESSLLQYLTEDEKQIISLYGGTTFEYGLFRLLSIDLIDEALKRIVGYFTNYSDEVIFPFAVDWFGRYFCIGKGEATAGLILFFDPATGESFEAEQDLAGFLNEILVDHRDDTFAYQRFISWRETSNVVLEFSDCVGFTVPLFLGGEDSVDNFSVIDIDVYWELNRQLFVQI